MEQRFSELVGAAKAKAFWKAWRDNFVTEAAIARIAALGFDSIRLPLNARLLMPDGQSTFDEDGFASVKRVVDWAHQHGIFVVLDMHAAPGGQTGTNIDADANEKPELLSDTNHRDRLVAPWKEIAQRYASEPAVLGYDLLNEPIAPAFSGDDGALWPIYQKVGAAIRTVDPHRTTSARRSDRQRRARELYLQSERRLLAPRVPLSSEGSARRDRGQPR